MAFGRSSVLAFAALLLGPATTATAESTVNTAYSNSGDVYDARPRRPALPKGAPNSPGAGRPSSAHVAISLGDGKTIEARGAGQQQWDGAPDRPIVAGRIYNPEAADDLPPPPTLAQRGSPQIKRGLTNFSAKIGDHLKGRPDASRLELYDYPGAYAQRFDGVDKGKTAPPKAPRAALRPK